MHYKDINKTSTRTFDSPLKFIGNKFEVASLL